MLASQVRHGFGDMDYILYIVYIAFCILPILHIVYMLSLYVVFKDKGIPLTGNRLKIPDVRYSSTCLNNCDCDTDSEIEIQ